MVYNRFEKHATYRLGVMQSCVSPYGLMSALKDGQVVVNSSELPRPYYECVCQEAQPHLSLECSVALLLSVHSQYYQNFDQTVSPPNTRLPPTFVSSNSSVVMQLDITVCPHGSGLSLDEF